MMISSRRVLTCGNVGRSDARIRDRSTSDPVPIRGRSGWATSPRPAAGRVVVLGHERDGIPPDALALIDRAVEIPMIGTGLPLNVAVAGSPVAYRLAGKP